MRVLKSVFRRKLRATLTILGITIGVLALVVMGAMVEKLTLLVDGGIKYYGDKVVVSDENAGSMTVSPISMDRIEDIEKVEGVRAASASISMLLGDMPTVSMGVPPMIGASDFAGEKYESFKLEAAEGRLLKEGDKKKAVVGADLVGKLDAKLGGTIDINGEKYKVVGILEKTLTAPDSEVLVSLADAQRLYVKTLPAALAGNVDKDTLATNIVVYPEEGVDPEKLAKRISKEVDGVSATGPKAFKDQVVSATQMLSSIIFGIALISLLVGGLSVVNTMTMSVSERTREVGVRKAIGATDGAIMRQFIAESGVIGLIGGLLGLAIGAGLAFLFNASGNASGTQLFLVTPRLAIGSVTFALGLGIVSGIYPAWHAAQLNPVQALRYE